MTTTIHPRLSSKPSFRWQDYEILEREYPHLWAKCYPRRYDVAGQYDSPKAVGRCMMDAILGYYHSYDSKKNMAGETEQAEAVWAAIMAKYRVPTYYVARDLAMALGQTAPAETFDCLEIKVPFPAAAFYLPKGTLVHAEYGEVSFIAYARMEGGSEIDLPHPNPKGRHTLHSHPGSSSFAIYMRTVGGITMHWQYNPEVRLVNLRDTAALEDLQARYSHSSTGPEKEFQNFTPTDITAMIAAIRLIFNLIMFMTIRPHMVEPAHLIKRVKKGPGNPVEYWQPHVIGASYKIRHIPGPPQGGTHASPHFHWVKGFVREQHYGPGRTLTKMKWIEPYTRGGAE